MKKGKSGKCLCGQVSYQVAGAPVIVAQCHCTACRRTSGTGHSVGAMFHAQHVELCGALSEFSYVSDHGSTVTKMFCATCGSPVLGTNSRNPDHVTLTLGTMDEAADLTVEVVIFKAQQPHWDQLDAKVMTFPKQPDWTPDR